MMANLDKLISLEANLHQLDTPPYRPSGWEVLGKTLIGLVIGVIISVLIFVMLGFTSEIFSQAWSVANSTAISANPLSGFLLLFIVFLASFLGNFGLLGFFNLFYPGTYKNGGKTFSVLLLANAIMLIVLAPMYFVFSSQTDISFLLLAFHIMFSIFISVNIMEYSSYGGYAISSIIGNTIGFCIVLLLYGIIWNSSGANSLNSHIYLMILLPPVLGYTVIPLGLGIWQKIYYRFYEMGSNPFYVQIEEEERPDTDESSARENYEEDKDDDVNIELN